jgi:hypothetical protein
MPTWHTHSTITGDVTAVGVVHTASTSNGVSEAPKWTDPGDVKVAIRDNVTESESSDRAVSPPLDDQRVGLRRRQ